MSTDGIYREPEAIVVPEGKATGCLPRKSKPGELCMGFDAMGIPLIDPKDWSKYTGKISLRPWVRQVLDQNGYGSCATESATGGLMICRAVQGLPHVYLNPLFIYHTTSGGRDGGSSIDENLDFMRANGVAPEALYPRSLGFRTEPSAEAKAAAKKFTIDEFFDITKTIEMVSALLSGHPVIWGAKGHAVCKVEHLNDREGLDLNSWGDWGDAGFGVWAPYSGVNYGYGAWALRTTKEHVAAVRAAMGL